MAQAIPTGHEGLIPHLIIDGAAKALDFYKEAFGAVEVMRMPAQDGVKLMHASMTIDGSPFYLADDFPEMGGPPRSPTALNGSTVTIHRYVEDCDAAVEKAKKAGATVKMPPQDMFWGDRYATVTDPFGHDWSIATHVNDPTPEEMAEAAKAAFS